MRFGEEYFRTLKYSKRERLIKRHFSDTLMWGSKVSDLNFLNGRGKTALDVGCAYGYGLEVLESFGYDAYGVDISKYTIKQGKKFYLADSVVCDVQESLPFRKKTFDLVTCFEVIEHLAHPLQAIKNMLVSCKDTMICTTPNKIVEKPVKKIIRDYDETHISVKGQKEWEKDISENVNFSFFKVEPFLDASLKVADQLLFFKSFKIPYLGLDLRILIRR